VPNPAEARDAVDVRSLIHRRTKKKRLERSATRVRARQRSIRSKHKLATRAFQSQKLT